MPTLALLPVIIALLAQQPAPSSTSVDFEFFKTRIQPILTAKRPGHARCVSCHSTGTPMRLQPLAPGSATWSEEESRKNFDVIRLRIVPGNPGASKLLRHPLEEQAGGALINLVTGQPFTWKDACVSRGSVTFEGNAAARAQTVASIRAVLARNFQVK